MDAMVADWMNLMIQLERFHEASMPFFRLRPFRRGFYARCLDSLIVTAL